MWKPRGSEWRPTGNLLFSALAAAIGWTHGGAAREIIWEEGGLIELHIRGTVIRVAPETVNSISCFSLLGRRGGLMTMRFKGGKAYLNPYYHDLDEFFERLRVANPWVQLPD